MHYGKDSDQISLQQLVTRESEYDSTTISSEPDLKMSLWQALRRWPKVAMYSMLLTSCITLWGYDGVLVGSVASMPAFLEVYGEKSDGEMEYIIPALWLALWGVSSSIGAMPGALMAGWISDRIGRTRVLAISTILSAVAVVGFICSDLPTSVDAKRGFFLGSKVFQGFAIGGIQTTCQTWISEAAPQQLRGSLLPIFPVFLLVGNILGSVVTQIQIDKPGREAYRITLGTIWIFSVLPLITCFVLPESPTWLLRRGRLEKASKSHKRLEFSKKYPTGYKHTFTKLQAMIARESGISSKKGAASYLDCLKGTDIRRTLIVCFCNVLPELFGMSLLGNAGYFLQTVGVSASTANIFFMAGIACGLLGNISTFFTLARFGRRQLILPTLGAVVLLWGALGVVGSIKSAPQVIIWWSAVSMTLVTTTAGAGVWPASYVVAAETSSLRLRARTQGLAWSFNGAISIGFQMGMPYLYNHDAADLGAQTGYVWFGFTAVAFIIAYFFIPEMKGRTSAEIDQMFQEKLPARKFKHWQGAGGDYTPINHSHDEDI